VTVREGGLAFEVNLSDYLDTGLFLDHRPTRALVREEAEGKRMLNLFCYTGSFSVYAAAGAARETVSVDLSNTYLDCEHRARRSEAPFDLVVADPPTFSRSARSETPWDVEQDHAEFLELVAANLAPGGIVYFSSNFRRFHFAMDRLAERFTIRDITARTIPEDFRDRRPHRAWRLVLRDSNSAAE